MLAESGFAAQIFECFVEHAKTHPLVTDPVFVSHELAEVFVLQWYLASNSNQSRSAPLGSCLCSGQMVESCTDIQALAISRTPISSWTRCVCTCQQSARHVQVVTSAAPTDALDYA